MADEAVTGPLFDGVVFSIIPSDDLPEERTNTLLTTLDNGGATFRALRDHDRSIDDIETITHVISTHVDFPQYSRCLDLGIFIVKPSWVRDCLQRGRQTSPRQHSPDPSQYFQDVVLCCADLPEGDAEAIKAGVIALGGQPSKGMTKLVTHIVTMSTDNSKCKIVEEKGLKCKIVLPHWFDACIRLGKKISEKPYQFPEPEILRRNNASVRPSPTPQLTGAVSATIPTSPPPSPSKSRKTFNALPCKKIYFSDDLDISEHFIEALTATLRVGGASIVNNVEQCDIYIGSFRAGKEYVLASQAGKEVANLAWLYHVIQRNKYTSPLRKLLHYPLPPRGIPGFENMRISLSNYSGEARLYVENLIKYSGAEYTKTMKQDNTHLITAHRSGEKCEAAQEWNIQVVNHLWLEESFAKCVIQATSNPRYIQFPTRTNLGEVTGQTSLDMKSVERIFFPRPKSPRKVLVPQKNKATLSASATKPARECLYSAAADIAAYQKETKRKGGVLYGGLRASGALDPDLSDGETQQAGAKSSKRPKTTNTAALPPVKYRMMVTGDDRWQHNSSKESRDKTALRQFGILLTQDPKEVDILVAPKLLRTKKFVCAIAGSPLVVHTSFLDAALDEKRLIENPPMLKDRDGEERLGFKLAESLDRAKQNQHKLFAGWSIYVTKDIKGGFDTYKDIITLNGGVALMWQGRTGMSFARRRPRTDAAAGAESHNQSQDDDFDCVYLVSGESAVEAKLWPTFRKEAEKQDLEARVVTSDWVLNAALSQEIVSRDKYRLDK
ncbi:hypothetical protein CERZMDRAFT_47623 [Cercospora zeae-maydis SCOH1-5]|uniref:BRCT domain-containing protein n=1 Tax=Cercospora zeae-maydis SCOH1-5 TaxID=717836 RepID=A0A6A6F8E2_9PEZI|nr:hypothetical protein CERZMDRAFT_47623 [Cercospora zeae-maydis SCOH1-5]